MIASGIIVTLIGYFSGLDVLKAFGGVLLVAMWGTSWMFRPPATAFEVARADANAPRRPSLAAKSPPLGALRQRLRARATAVAASPVAADPAAERDRAAAPPAEVARPAEVAGTTVDSAELSRAAANLCSPART